MIHIRVKSLTVNKFLWYSLNSKRTSLDSTLCSNMAPLKSGGKGILLDVSTDFQISMWGNKITPITSYIRIFYEDARHLTAYTIIYTYITRTDLNADLNVKFLHNTPTNINSIKGIKYVVNHLVRGIIVVILYELK